MYSVVVVDVVAFLDVEVVLVVKIEDDVFVDDEVIVDVAVIADVAVGLTTTSFFFPFSVVNISPGIIVVGDDVVDVVVDV